ncbi:hypothetical protein AB0M44_44025 [Streptosporangium subroseum]|uniref:hypothetical protein n=1 Tax=Streptosporangium subroseum TaxID=106412 RepID=UPI003430CA0B
MTMTTHRSRTRSAAAAAAAVTAAAVLGACGGENVLSGGDACRTRSRRAGKVGSGGVCPA